MKRMFCLLIALGLGGMCFYHSLRRFRLRYFFKREISSKE